MRRTPPAVVHLQPAARVQAGVAVLAALAAPCRGAFDGAFGGALPRRLHLRLCLRLRLRLRWGGETCWLRAPDADDETLVRRDVVIDLDRWLLRASPVACQWPRARHQQPAAWGARRAALSAAPARRADA